MKRRLLPSLVRATALVAVAVGVGVLGSVPAAARKKHHSTHATPQSRTPTDPSGTVGNFSYGELQSQTVGASGCGTNIAGEPAIHVSRTNNVFLGSEQGLGGGSEFWRGLGATGGSGASGCGLEYRGQPNVVVPNVGASGGDIDIAIASALNPLGNYTVYVSSLNLGSVNVAHSTDNGTTFSQTPVQAGLPLDDRDWIAAFGAQTSLLTYHDATNDIDVLRSDNGGAYYTQISQVIPEGDYKAGANELGNLVIDHRNLPDSTGDFYAYQSFVAPSDSSGSTNNEAWLGVSSDGGHTWTDQPVPCSVTASGTKNGLDHNFPNISVDPSGNIWYAWSDDHNVYTAESSDHGQTWTCSSPVSTNTAQAIFPWLAATSSGVDLVYYGSPTTKKQTWYVYFAQTASGSWGTPKQLMAVHKGSVCESGISCTGGRQLLDDFGVDTDSLGWAHIAFTSDADPNTGQFALGQAGSATGYAVQTGGTAAGSPNN
jgi:hypothetical protein